MKKEVTKYFAIGFLLIVFVLSLLGLFNLTGHFTGGDGSIGDPYQISNCTELQNMNQNLSAHYQLVDNVDCSGITGFEPVGNLTHPFHATFDGQGFVIEDLVIDCGGQDYCGFFGVIGSNITNLHLENYTLFNATDYVGGLVGSANSNEGLKITNCSITNGSINGNNYTGGLVGKAFANENHSIVDSFFTGNVNGSNYVGGLAGSFRGGKINNSYVVGDVSGDRYVGGSVGRFLPYDNNFSYSNVTGNVNGSNYVGGSIGEFTGSYAVIENSIANVNIYDSSDDGQGYVGGFVGFYDGTENIISFSSSRGNIYAHDTAGGFVGQMRGSKNIIFQSYSIGEINGSSQIGGFIGDFSPYSSEGMILDSYSLHEVHGKDQTGGFVGRFGGWKSTINNSYFSGSVTNTTVTNIGGFTGQIYDVSIICNNNFYDNETSNKSDTKCATPKPTSEMKDITQYSNAGWDIEENFQYKLNNGYPYLSWQIPGNSPIWYVYNYCPLMNGSGTFADPYNITRCCQLQNMDQNLSAHYQLVDNVDCSNTSNPSHDLWNGGKGFDPVGNSVNQFNGSVEGNNYNITDLYINRSAEDRIGLFGEIENANVSEINLINVNITGGSTYVGGLVGKLSGSNISDLSVTGKVIGMNDYVGGLAGVVYTSTILNSYSNISVEGGADVGGLAGAIYGTTVSNSYSTGNVIGEGYYLGGLVGYSNGGDIFDCYSEVNVNGTDGCYYNGGLVGRMDSGNVLNSYSTGNVIGEGTSTAGLIGYLQNSYINNSYATGNVRGEDDYIGGLIGQSISSSNISNSYSTGNVEGASTSNLVGGLIGDSDYSIITNSYSASSIIKGDRYIGGLIGESSYSTVNNSYATGKINGSYDVGGLTGYFFNSNVSNSYATGEVNGDTQVGGFAGYIYENTNIFNSYATGDVKGITYYVGGLVGLSSGYSTINNSYATGNAAGERNVGGLVGFSFYTTILNSYATGNVNGSAYLGGLSGFFDAGDINNSYATGNVNGSDIVGGLVGYSDLSNVSNSYATGEVNGDTQVGGFAGYIYEFSTINNSYATGEVNGDTQVGGFAGVIRYSSNISNSYSAGSVSNSSSTNIGGFMGQIYDVSIICNNNFYDNETSNKSDTKCATPKPTSEMKDITQYSNAGWDIETNSDYNINDGYPYLSWQIPGNSPIWYVYKAPPKKKTSGGGGGGTTRVKNFSVSPESIIVKLNPGEEDTKSISINNTGETSLSLELALINPTGKNFENHVQILTSPLSFILEKDQLKTIGIEFVAGESSGVYSGRLLVEDSKTEDVYITLIVGEECNYSRECYEWSSCIGGTQERECLIIFEDCTNEYETETRECESEVKEEIPIADGKGGGFFEEVFQGIRKTFKEHPIASTKISIILILLIFLAYTIIRQYIRVRNRLRGIPNPEDKAKALNTMKKVSKTGNFFERMVDKAAISMASKK